MAGRIMSYLDRALGQPDANRRRIDDPLPDPDVDMTDPGIRRLFPRQCPPEYHTTGNTAGRKTAEFPISPGGRRQPLEFPISPGERRQLLEFPISPGGGRQPV